MQQSVTATQSLRLSDSWLFAGVRTKGSYYFFRLSNAPRFSRHQNSPANSGIKCKWWRLKSFFPSIWSPSGAKLLSVLRKILKRKGSGLRTSDWAASDVHGGVFPTLLNPRFLLSLPRPASSFIFIFNSRFFFLVWHVITQTPATARLLEDLECLECLEYRRTV